MQSLLTNQMLKNFGNSWHQPDLAWQGQGDIWDWTGMVGMTGSPAHTASHPPAGQSRLVHQVPQNREWKPQDLLKSRCGTGTLPFSPQSLSQSKSQRQSRFKGQGNRFCFLMGGATNNCGHFCNLVHVCKGSNPFSNRNNLA